MSEVKRYFVQLFKLSGDQQKYAHGGLGAVEIVRSADFDRVLAEREALQQRLNVADQRVDELEGLLRDARRYVESAWPDGVHSYRKNSLSGDLLGKIDAALNPTCSCPSGDGSLRWPCKVHPPVVGDEVKP